MPSLPPEPYCERGELWAVVMDEKLGVGTRSGGLCEIKTASGSSTSRVETLLLDYIRISILIHSS